MSVHVRRVFEIDENSCENAGCEVVLNSKLKSWELEVEMEVLTVPRLIECGSVDGECAQSRKRFKGGIPAGNTLADLYGTLTRDMMLCCQDSRVEVYTKFFR